MLIKTFILKTYRVKVKKPRGGLKCICDEMKKVENQLSKYCKVLSKG